MQSLFNFFRSLPPYKVKDMRDVGEVPSHDLKSLRSLIIDFGVFLDLVNVVEKPFKIGLNMFLVPIKLRPSKFSPYLILIATKLRRSQFYRTKNIFNPLNFLCFNRNYPFHSICLWSSSFVSARGQNKTKCNISI